MNVSRLPQKPVRQNDASTKFCYVTKIKLPEGCQLPVCVLQPCLPYNHASIKTESILCSQPCFDSVSILAHGGPFHTLYHSLHPQVNSLPQLSQVESTTNEASPLATPDAEHGVRTLGLVLQRSVEAEAQVCSVLEIHQELF